MQDARQIAADRIEQLYRERGSELLRSVLLYAGDREVANDAVAEAFAQAIRRGQALADPDRWVTKVAFRIAAGELQNRRRHDYPLAERAYTMPEPTGDLVAALAQLSPKQRAAAVLHFRDGYTLAEVASLIGSTTSAVGVHLHRARTRLADLLEATDD
jgi:RNA polymerase sigma-70 factor (ECF subfamily)